MSFFYDVFEYFDLDLVKSNVVINYILNVGAVIYGDLKIIDLQENQIILSDKKQKITIFGDKLMIKSISKGEVCIEGGILKIESGEQ